MFSAVLKGQSKREHIETGNELYEQQQYAEAEASYLKALAEDPNMQEGIFNLGDALYKEERFEGAAKQFQEFANTLTNPEQKAQAYHNLGNSLLKAELYEEGVEAYKQALRHNSNDLDTKYNLSYAQQKLKKQEQEQEEENKEDQEQKDKQDQESEDKKKQEEKEQQENENQKNSEEENEDDQRKPEDSEEDQTPKKEDQPKENESQAQPQPQGLTEEEAARLLNALLNEEKKVQEKLQKQKIKPKNRGTDKDW